MSSEPDEQHARELVTQRTIAQVAAESEGAQVSDTIERLRVALVTQGLEPPPEGWLEAVAHDAVNGRTYVVSEQALAEAGVDIPELDALQAGEPNGEPGEDGPRKGDQPN